MVKFASPPPPSVQEAEQALKAAKEAEAERKEQIERERKEEQRAHAELVKQANAVAVGVRRQVEDALAHAEQNPPQPNHFHRTVCRAYLRGTLVPPDVMDTAESRVVLSDPALGNLLAAAQEAANRLAYYTNPELDSFLLADDPPVVELDQLEADVWRVFVRRIREIASED